MKMNTAGPISQISDQKFKKQFHALPDFKQTHLIFSFEAQITQLRK